ncbi:MAG: Amuc_1102 family pilus-like protein [Chthoniobacteraceae bacterium]
MKTSALSLLAITALGLHAFAQAPVGPGSIKVGKVEVAAPNTPEFTITGGQTKRYKLGKWIEMEIGYDTKLETIDELTFKFTIQIEGKLLDGEVTYAGIAEGKDHYAVMYVSPKIINTLLKGKAFTAASIENVWVDVTKAGQKLSPTVSMKQAAMPNVPHITGLVLRKDQTPFAPLFYDRYEEIKSGR